MSIADSAGLQQPCRLESTIITGFTQRVGKIGMPTLDDWRATLSPTEIEMRKARESQERVALIEKGRDPNVARPWNWPDIDEWCRFIEQCSSVTTKKR